MRFLIDVWASTMHACFDFRISLDSPQVSPCQVFEPCKAKADSTDNSNFLRAFFHGVLEVHVIRIDEMNASQLSGIVELRFFDGSLPLFSSLSRF